MDQGKLDLDTYSEEYRHQTELRYISSMDLSGRRKYLGLVLEKRGVVALNKLKEGLELLWKSKKQSKV
jgi:hypothetical protein